MQIIEFLTFLEAACKFQSEQDSPDKYHLFQLAIPKSFKIFWGIFDVLNNVRNYSGVSNVEAAAEKNEIVIPSTGCTSQSSLDERRHNFAIIHNGQYEFKGDFLCLTGLIFRLLPEGEAGNYEPYGQIKYYLNRAGNDLNPAKIDITKVPSSPVVAFGPAPREEYLRRTYLSNMAAAAVAGPCMTGGALPGFHVTGSIFGLGLGGACGCMVGGLIGDEVRDLVDANSK